MAQLFSLHLFFSLGSLFFAVPLLQAGQEPLWGLSERQGNRDSMEDCSVVSSLSIGQQFPAAYLFGLFDGHAGDQASKYAATRLEQALRVSFKMLSAGCDNFDELVYQSFLVGFGALDLSMRYLYQNDGTAALTALYTKNNVYVSWVGDSRALVLDKTGRVKAETKDHKPDSPTEIERYGTDAVVNRFSIVQDQNGSRSYRPQKFNQELFLKEGESILVTGPWRLGPLSLSRALGDRKAKSIQPLISAEPDVIRVEVSSGDIIVLACDGIWDVMSSEEVGAYIGYLSQLDEAGLIREVAQDKDPAFDNEDGSDHTMKLFARAIRNKAYERGSEDNLSVLIFRIP